MTSAVIIMSRVLCFNTSANKCSSCDAPSGRLSAAVCRLCHGKFSPRSLRHAFNKWPQDSLSIVDEESDAVAQSPLLFHTDFQRLVGVQVDRDPRLSEFICKKCHAKFYKCQSILIRFLQRVNLPPALLFSSAPSSFTSDTKCLHSLVSWAHHHGEACRSCPDLKEVLEGQCLGAIKAVWGCVNGHRYIMDTHRSTTSNQCSSNRALGSGRGDGAMSEEEEQEQDGEEDEEEVISEDEFDEGRKGGLSDEEFEPYSEKRWVQIEKTGLKSSKAPEEPKIRKKPGPKPGWKNKFKPKGEELPNIYKCPYQGCTAVYRAPDGLKKHIKEHHEEVRERPCPHPGCNKVCGFQCRQRASLKYHMTKHKAEADLEFECLMCSKRFEKAHNLNVHMSMVHPLTQAEAQRGCGKAPPTKTDGERESRAVCQLQYCHMTS
uniref:Zinc finger protein 276 n=1 Tax=Haplochromis burtoni TaxID=8153 RepID=A0A3Q2W8J6_HAPBU